MNPDLWDVSLKILLWGGLGGVAVFALAHLIDWYSNTRMPDDDEDDFW